MNYSARYLFRSLLRQRRLYLLSLFKHLWLTLLLWPLPLLRYLYRSKHQ